MNENFKTLSDSQRVEEQARKTISKKIHKSHPRTNYPKKNRSAYIFFTQEYKNEVLKHQPNCHLNTLMKEIAEKWATMTENARLPYIKLAHQDKNRYFQEKKLFFENHDKALLLKSRKKPKKENFLTPYILFAGDERAKLKGSHPGLNPVEIMKEIALRWKNLSDEQKKPYYELYEKKKKEKVAMDSRGIESFFANFRHSKKKKQVNKAKFKSSPFLIFCQEKRAQDKTIKNVSELSEIWQNLSPRQKEEYQKRYLCEKEKFLIKNAKERREFENKSESMKSVEEDRSCFIVEEKEQKKKDSIESFFSDYSRFLEARKKFCS